MYVDKITMPREVAQAEWKKYNALLKKRKDKYLEDMIGRDNEMQKVIA